jgi:hypothetical protein
MTYSWSKLRPKATFHTIYIPEVEGVMCSVLIHLYKLLKATTQIQALKQDQQLLFIEAFASDIHYLQSLTPASR